MAPAPIDDRIIDVAEPLKATLGLPEPALARLRKAGIDLSQGYPYRPSVPLYLQDVEAIRGVPWAYEDRGAAPGIDRSKSSLLSAASSVEDLTTHIGTEIRGLQLAELTDAQRDELALLIAERGVVFFRDQTDLTPQQQLALGKYYGKVEVHPQVPQVPLKGKGGKGSGGEDQEERELGVTVIWPALQAAEGRRGTTHFRNPGGASRWHADLVHELQPAGITHLHNDTVPPTGGDTLWASGYAAYEKLSPGFRRIVDGKQAVYRSSHAYLDRGDPSAGPRYVERTHPLVRTHPATGWRSLFVNRAMTVRIVGLDPAESDLLLGYLCDVFEKNVDIQCRFKWTPGTSALWDNRVTIHNASWDYAGEYPRHGTRVTSLAEKPYFDPASPTRRQALGMLHPGEGVLEGVDGPA